MSSAACGVGLMIFISVAAAAGAGAAEELLLAYNPTGYAGGGCNLFYGKWAADGTYPLYNNNGCPFIDPQFDCLKYGRPDKSFLYYAWKPAAAAAAGSCSLPRFEGGDLLKRWRGKRIMYVGDSLSLNMWQSMACMLHSAAVAAAARASFSYARNAPIPYVTFKDYDLTIHFYHSNYLVDLVKETKGMVLNLDSIQQGGDVWKSMDVLIFNSWHWWTHTGTSQPWNFVQDGTNSYQDMDRLEAFHKGLTTWGKWVDQNVDPQRTKVYFMGISPSHYMGKEWGSPSKTCRGEKLPVEGSMYPAAGEASGPEEVVKKVLNGIRKPVYLLDITLLSELRKDAHPSNYSGNHPGLDCSHWCLPGVPDTWNHLLYASLLQ
ncbi:unnamed protein product [Cuscuta campestris]|uniref:Uncharacterized protein n=1 Tax=Cuscuta campestris TaxID=132261 RepID=A0A484MKH2_9ASTE|nr:unnamed protein product [Cuscuta campestris]